MDGAWSHFSKHHVPWLTFQSIVCGFVAFSGVQEMADAALESIAKLQPLLW